MAFEISVFLENKIAHFEEITQHLREAKINIRSLILNNILSWVGSVKSVG